MDYKKIRIDYYWYRFRKGRAEVLLELVKETDDYRVPFHYVTAEENIIWRLSSENVEDDGDLVVIEHEKKSWKMNVGDKEWISLDKIKDLNLMRNETSHITCNIYRFFLDLFPCEKEPVLRHRVKCWLDEVMTKEAQKQYLAELQDILDGNLPVLLDAFIVKKPDPELVRREMETLEHFRICKSNSSARDAYGYSSINLEALGAKIEFVDMFSTDDISP